MFDCDTEDFAITAGNDRKIRYWDLTSLRQKSYQLNSPNDDEVQYLAELHNKEQTIIVEKIGDSNKFPKMNA